MKVRLGEASPSPEKERGNMTRSSRGSGQDPGHKYTWCSVFRHREISDQKKILVLHKQRQKVVKERKISGNLREKNYKMGVLNKKNSYQQCCGSKYIEFGSGSRAILSTLKVKIHNNFREKLFSLKQVPIFFQNCKNKLSPKEIFNQLSLGIVNYSNI